MSNAWKGFTCYAELLEAAMISEENAKPLYAFLKASQARRAEEERIIKQVRKAKPGLADFEILKRYESHLETHFPRPKF